MHRINRPLLLILLISSFLLTLNIGARWWGPGDENGAWISAVVRNYQRYGASELRFLQVLNEAPAAPDTLRYYNHHPPLVSWISAISVSLFGSFEVGLRWVSISATLVGIALFYVLSRQLVKQRQALWATAFYAFTPMMAYYGRMPDHEALALVWLLSYFIVFLRWREQPTAKYWWGLVIFAVLAAWTAWATLLFIGLSILVSLRPAAYRKQAFMLSVLTLLSVVIMLGYYQLAWSGTFEDLMQAFIWRSSSLSGRSDTSAFTIAEFIIRQLGHMVFFVHTRLAIPCGFRLVVSSRQNNFRTTNHAVHSLGWGAALHFDLP